MSHPTHHPNRLKHYIYHKNYNLKREKLLSTHRNNVLIQIIHQT